MKSAVFYFDHDDYDAAIKSLPLGCPHPSLHRFVRYRVVTCSAEMALQDARPQKGEIVLNSVLLEE